MQSSLDKKHSLVFDLIGYAVYSQDFPSSKQYKTSLFI